MCRTCRSDFDGVAVTVIATATSGANEISHWTTGSGLLVPATRESTACRSGAPNRGAKKAVAYRPGLGAPAADVTTRRRQRTGAALVSVLMPWRPVACSPWAERRRHLLASPPLRSLGWQPQAEPCFLRRGPHLLGAPYSGCLRARRGRRRPVTLGAGPPAGRHGRDGKSAGPAWRARGGRRAQGDDIVVEMPKPPVATPVVAVLGQPGQLAFRPWSASSVLIPALATRRPWTAPAIACRRPNATGPRQLWHVGHLPG